MREGSQSGRSQLLPTTAGASSSRNVTLSMQPEESDPTADPVDLRQMTRKLRSEQDKGLDMLDEIISRQKGLVKGISNQIDVQNEIIEDIGEHMDTTTVRLTRSTRNVTRVSKKADSCCYWIIIVLLLVAIVVVAVW